MISHATTHCELQKRAAESLLSDEPTVELVVKAKGGDCQALEALLQRCLPSIRRWAHGRLPTAARRYLDTGDIVQEVVLHAIARLEVFEPRHVGAMQAYLHRAVINRIRDEVRRVQRRPAPMELSDDCELFDWTSPLELAIQAESYQRYREALTRLRAKDRELVVGRIEMQWSASEVAERFAFPTIDAARMAVKRALQRLSAQLAKGKHQLC